MKQNSQKSSGGKLRALFCLGLSAVMAVGVALNTTAATKKTVQYDISVCSSPTHTAVLSEDSLYLLGTNDYGQFPGSNLTYTDEPVKLGEDIADVAVSDGRTLTVSKTGQLRYYGLDPVAETMTGAGGKLVANGAKQVEAQSLFAAYIDKNGAVYTWGKNEYSRLGTGTDTDADKPVKIIDGDVKKVALGNAFGLALKNDGTVYAWGDIAYLTDDENDETVVTPVKIADNAKDVTAGDYHGCILKKDGSLYTFGDNTFCQAGVGGLSEGAMSKVMTGISSVTSGAYHNFAISTNGTVYTWGYGLSGQLGNGSTSCIDKPTETSFEFVQMFACNENSFGISEDGSIYSFGNNTNYRLGKSNGSDSLSPVRVLDNEMNWVYTDEPENLHPDHAVDGSGSTDGSADMPATDEAPEAVVTPFAGGYSNGTFAPAKSVTRAEFLKMLVLALREDFDPTANYGTSSYSDVPLGEWYENYIAFAEQNKLASGYSDGTFHPNAPITRAEAAKLTASFLGLELKESAFSGFDDVDYTGSKWASPAIWALVAQEVINGYSDNTFRPTNNISRAEAVVMISKAAGFKPTDDEQTAYAQQFSTSPFSDVSTSIWYYSYILRAVGYVK